jgi:hypothetical protein
MKLIRTTHPGRRRRSTTKTGAALPQGQRTQLPVGSERSARGTEPWSLEAVLSSRRGAALNRGQRTHEGGSHELAIDG